MSASRTPTFCPMDASAAARFTVTEDLPTPPLPLATANTRVSDDGSANGITFSGRPPRSRACSSLRCSSLMTSSRTVTPVTPGTADTAAVTSLVMVSRSGQPATVRYTSTPTLPSGATSTPFTMPSSVMGRRISGSFTLASAAVTCSTVGGEETTGGEAMPQSYAGRPPRLVPGRPAQTPGSADGFARRPDQRTGSPVARISGRVRPSPGSADGLARRRVEEQSPSGRLMEVEHPLQRAGQSVERAVADPRPVEPVVLDERE